jgi:excisionase family DNA binding protein
MDKPIAAPRFLTVDELAELLRVSPRSVYDWVSQGVIPFHKAGRRTIFLLDEILEWTKDPRADANSGKRARI